MWSGNETQNKPRSAHKRTDSHVAQPVPAKPGKARSTAGNLNFKYYEYSINRVYLRVESGEYQIMLSCVF